MLDSEHMRLRAALEEGLKALRELHIPSAQLAAELLLMHILGCDRSFLYSHPEFELPPEALQRYRDLIQERASGKPTQYITGHQEFWGLDLEVTPDVLIPRPETEHVVEAVTELASKRGFGREAALRLADVGTGSGAIALALALEFPRAFILATDISRAALRVAARNAWRLGFAGRVRFVHTDLLAGLRASTPNLLFDFVACNPPYVGRDELDLLQREVREFEPRLAWGGLERGEEVYSRLFPQAFSLLKPGGYVVVEVGYQMADRVCGLLGKAWSETEVRPDLAGIPRVVISKKA